MHSLQASLLKHTVLVISLILSSCFLLLIPLASTSFASDVSKGTGDSNSPPLKQFRVGVQATDIQCKSDFVRVIKMTDFERIYCVKLDTKSVLIQHGWAFDDKQECRLPQKCTSSISIDRTVYPVKEFVDANNIFAFDMFSNLTKGKQENAFFSPYSVSNAFSIVYEGANGTTRDEIQSVFHFIKDDQTRKNSAYASLSDLNVPGHNYTLSSANALWVQNDFQLLKEYADMVKTYYLAKTTNLDFKNNAEGSRQTINKWVGEKTNDKIQDLLPPGSVLPITKAVITNAVYFKGYWSIPFVETMTQDEDFKIDALHTVKVHMMSNNDHFNYASTDDLQILQMYYKGGDLSMLILLPKNNDLKSLEEKISATNLNEWESKIARKDVQMYLPKFTFDKKYTLNENLKQMGIPSAFTPEMADFSGITGKKDLVISNVVHQAFISVDEKGTEAAAATGIIMGPTAAMPREPPEMFRADHPFIFLIQDERTGLILFMGKVVDPTLK